MSSQRWPVYSAVAGFVTVGLIALASMGLSGSLYPHLPASWQGTPGKETGAARQGGPAQPGAAAVAAPIQQAAANPDGYYEQLRSRLRWVRTRIGTDVLLTPDLHSRMLLAKSAARRARLQEVGLSFLDVYGIINAETSWVPRTGASKDGTPNLGIAQFEPATAKALGLRNPNDPVEAVHAAALHMKEAAIWSAERLDGLKLRAGERAEKLREGVSIYYNLSTRGRSAWNGRNTRKLPIETRRHIVNARLGAQEAAVLEAQMQVASFRPATGEAVLTAGIGPDGN